MFQHEVTFNFSILKLHIERKNLDVAFQIHFIGKKKKTQQNQTTLILVLVQKKFEKGWISNKSKF